MGAAPPPRSPTQAGQRHGRIQDPFLNPAPGTTAKLIAE